MRTGRPTFQLDADRLRRARKDAGLTQAALARKVYKELGKPNATANTATADTATADTATADTATADTATKHYQKIERTGKTSEAMARALAKVLETTVAELQGAAPDELPHWIDCMESQLRRQFDIGASPGLQVALEQESGATDPVRELAIRIAERLEYVQLGPQSHELTRLVELTGWTEAQLLKPVNLHGHWLLRSSVNGVRNSSIVIGTNEVMSRIESTCSEYACIREIDAVITLREELPWLHVEVAHPRIPSIRSSFSFVRCEPTTSGLRWGSPTWRDRFWLDQRLLSWAFKSANFVVRFDGHAVPRDVRALRLVIERSSEDQTAHVVAEIKGDLGELPDDLLSTSRREGGSHDLATNWIAAGLWDALAPLLNEWPTGRWRVQSSGCIVIDLDPSIAWAGWQGAVPDFRIKYLLRLFEEGEPGQLRPAPWRGFSVEVIAQLLRQLIRDDVDRTQTATTPQDASPPN